MNYISECDKPGDIVARYFENKKEIKRISSETKKRIDELSETSKVRIHNIEETIDELKEEIYAIDRKFRQEMKEAEIEKEALIKPLHGYNQYVNRVLDMLKMAEHDNIAADILDTDISTYNGKELVWLDYIYNDEFLKIRLIVAENTKPKNKYSLIAYGHSVFMIHELMHRYYHYNTVSLRDDPANRPGFSIRAEIVSLPSIDDIKKYVSKHKIMQDVISEHQRLKSEYDAVVKKYKLSDFKDIIDTQKEAE